MTTEAEASGREWEVRLEFPDGHKETRIVSALSAEDAESRAIEHEAARTRPSAYMIGITPEGLALGHRYVMGNVNAYCPKCSEEASEAAGRPICVLDCDYDLDK